MSEPNIPAIFDVMAKGATAMGWHLLELIDRVNQAQQIDGTAAGYRIKLQLIEHWLKVKATVPWYPPHPDEIEALQQKLAEAEHIERLCHAVETFLN